VSADIEDPFLATFFSRISKPVARSFTPEQLDAIKLAFGARSPGAHTVDLRISVPFGLRWFYVVLLVGPERRVFDRNTVERLFRPVWTAANTVVLGISALLFAAALFTVVYAGKRALGIDIVPGVDMLPDKAIERVILR